MFRMGLKDTILRAYRSIAGKKEDANQEYDFGVLSDIEQLDEGTREQETALLMHIDPEMRDYISTAGNKLNNIALPPKVIPVHFLTDAPTGAQVMTMLGMVRWAMEKSAKNGKEISFKVVVNNRNDSPFLVGMGDVSIPKVAVQDFVEIGN